MQSFVSSDPFTITIDAKTAVKMYASLLLPINRQTFVLAWHPKDAALQYREGGYSMIKFLSKYFPMEPFPAKDLIEAVDALGKAAEHHQSVQLTAAQYRAVSYPQQVMEHLVSFLRSYVSDDQLKTAIRTELDNDGLYQNYLAKQVQHYATVDQLVSGLREMGQAVQESQAHTHVIQPAISKAMQEEMGHSGGQSL